MFDFLTDQNFLNALMAMIGPLAFFAAPSEEIELLLLSQPAAIATEAVEVPAFEPSETGFAEAA